MSTSSSDCVMHPNAMAPPPKGGLSETWTGSNPMPFFNVRWNDNKVFKIQQSYNVATILTPSTSTFQNYATAFTASSLTQISSLTAVFDQYRIDFVECWIVPRQMASVAAGTATSTDAQMFSVIDYDDANALSVGSDYLSYTNCITTPGFMGHYRKFVPRMAIAAYGSGVFTSYANEGPQWIDAGTTAVAHYGLKVGVGVIGNVGAQVYDMFVRLTTSWRAVR